MRLTKFLLGSLLLATMTSEPSSFSQALTGYSYRQILTLVTNEGNQRSNIGLDQIGGSTVDRGTNDDANAEVTLIDQNGLVAAQQTFVVKPDEVLQINSIVSTLGAPTGSYQVNVWSDVPLETWASIIDNSNGDSAIYTGTALGFQRGAILSSANVGSFVSDLTVANDGFGGGEFQVLIYDNAGTLIRTETHSIQAFGLLQFSSIRENVLGTFGKIEIQAVDAAVVLTALSKVVDINTRNNSFFPATTLLPRGITSVAGVWEGAITGTAAVAGTQKQPSSHPQINIEAKLILQQNRKDIFGVLEIVSGDFPEPVTSVPVRGVYRLDSSKPPRQSLCLTAYSPDPENKWVMTLDSDFAQGIPDPMTGRMLYVNQVNQSDAGVFMIDRNADLRPAPQQ